MRRARAAAVTLLTLSLVPCYAGVADAQESIGDFFLFERVDPDSGEDRSSITALAEENFVSGAGGLTLQCSEDGFELVVTATYLGRNVSTPVQYAFAELEPPAADWMLRSTGMAAVAPPDVRDAFVERALDETSVTMRVRDFQMRTHTYTFHLEGLGEALTRLDCR